ncbi:MAG: hypothetical protein AAGC46_09390 [Solirubrobacteraceae bacterium]|nr:hypothetical protein [Patulibacter sp.]
MSKVFGGPITGGTCSTSATPTNTSADTYQDFCVAYDAKNDEGPTGKDLSSVVVDTPAGFAGNADKLANGDPAPQCTDDQFNVTGQGDAGCAANTQVGSVTANIRAKISDRAANNGALTAALGDQYKGDGVVQLAPTGKVYNLTHSDNEVARLGIDLSPKADVVGIPDAVDQPNVKIIVRVTLRPNPDVGLRSIITGLPKTADVNFGGGASGLVVIPGVLELPPDEKGDPLAVDGFALTFFGPAHTGTQPFAFLGSDCTADQNTQIRATDETGGASSADSLPYRLTNCDSASIPFLPSAQYTTTEHRPDVTTETQVYVRFGTSSTPGYVASTVKKTVVTLPTGLSFSGQIASGPNGLPLCTADQFAVNSAPAATCPAATAVGTVKFTSPVLAHVLTGNAYLGPQPSPGALPDLYIEAQLGTADDAPRVKLIGKLTIDSQNRIVTTLDNLPQVPVSEFALTFRGGDQSAVVTPPTCGTTQGALGAYSWANAGTSVDSTQSYTVDQDCDAVKGFGASVGFSVDNAASAGHYSPLTTTVARPDRSPRLKTTVINLPPGELAAIKGVPECTQAQAAASACPDSTKVGTITSLAGVGPAPYQANGTIYLMARSGSDVAALSLHVPVKFGEVYLGDLNVPARVVIRPNDLGLQVIADVPERYDGIPLNIRQLSIKLDRANFSLSPTNCSALTTQSSITATDGQVSTPTSTFQVSGCDKLGFAPELMAAVNGQTSNNGRPNVSVRITSPDQTSALKQTFVTLPKGIGVDLKQIPRACKLSDFATNTCPSISAIGKASGTLAITDEPLAGNVYLLKIDGQTLPGVGLSFTGRFAGNVQGTTAIDPKTSQLVTSFPTIPDLPLTALQLDITGGTDGLLVATTALCNATSVNFTGKFVAQSGPTVNRTASTYCGSTLNALTPKLSGKVSGVTKGKPAFSISATTPIVSGVQSKIKTVDLNLPSGYSLVTSRAKSSKGVAVKSLSVKGKSTTKRITSRKLRVKLPTAGTTKFHLLTRTNTVTIASSSKRKSKAKLVLSLTITYTNGAKTTVPFRLTPH